MTNKQARTDREIELLLTLIDEAYDKKAWHGPNLKGSIRGLSARHAAWRPQLGRHNIWELVLHAAYWKYAVARRITGAKRGSFGLPGSNWIEPSAEQGEAVWKRDVALLATQHRELRRVIAGLSSSRLRSRKQWEAMRRMILGIAAHDLYHAGQIQLLKRLCPIE